MSRLVILALLGSMLPLTPQGAPQQFNQAVNDADLTELEGTPFMLNSGVPYRDLLTIGASQAVATFASRFQPEERQRILNNRATAQRGGRNGLNSPQFYSQTVSQPTGRAKLDTLEFSASRRIRVPEELRRDRVLADRDEALLIAQRDAEDRAAAHQSARRPSVNSLGLGRPRTSGLGRPAPAPVSAGNYQTVVGHGHSYSTNTNYGGTPAPYVATTTTSYASYPHPPVPTASPYHPTIAPLTLSSFDYSYSPPPPSHYAVYPAAQYASYLPSPAPAILPSPRPTVDYNIEVTHGASGGSYSYSTFG